MKIHIVQPVCGRSVGELVKERRAIVRYIETMFCVDVEVAIRPAAANMIVMAHGWAEDPGCVQQLEAAQERGQGFLDMDAPAIVFKAVEE